MKTLLATILLITNLNIFAHGENKLGPNKGYIRMPGLFHTELIKLNDHQFEVYLMNVNNQNPSVKNSDVQLQHLSNSGQKTSFVCKASTNKFICTSENKNLDLKSGKILLTATREGEKGKVAEYQLPLSLVK